MRSNYQNKSRGERLRDLASKLETLPSAEVAAFLQAEMKLHSTTVLVALFLLMDGVWTEDAEERRQLMDTFRVGWNEKLSPEEEEMMGLLEASMTHQDLFHRRRRAENAEEAAILTMPEDCDSTLN